MIFRSNPAKSSHHLGKKPKHANHLYVQFPTMGQKNVKSPPTPTPPPPLLPPFLSGLKLICVQYPRARSGTHKPVLKFTQALTWDRWRTCQSRILLSILLKDPWRRTARKERGEMGRDSWHQAEHQAKDRAGWRVGVIVALNVPYEQELRPTLTIMLCGCFAYFSKFHHVFEMSFSMEAIPIAKRNFEQVKNCIIK